MKCAWCEKEKGIRTRGSHGICKKHQEQMEKEIEKLRKKKKGKS